MCVCVCVCVSTLTTAVSCVWGSAEAALKRGFLIHQDSHSLGCELYSAQDKMVHFVMCGLIWYTASASCRGYETIWVGSLTQATLSRFHSSLCRFSCRLIRTCSLSAILWTTPSTFGSSSITRWRHTAVLLYNTHKNKIMRVPKTWTRQPCFQICLVTKAPSKRHISHRAQCLWTADSNEVSYDSFLLWIFDACRLRARTTLSLWAEWELAGGASGTNTTAYIQWDS